MELLQTIELEKKYLAVRIDRRLAATLIINAIQKGQDVSIAITALLTEDHTSIVLPLPTTHTMDDVKALLLTFWGWYEWSLAKALKKEFRTRDADQPVV